MIRNHITHLVKNTSGYTLAGVLPQMMGFLMLPVYTRFLTPEDFGLLALVTVISLLLAMFMKMQLHGAITRFYIEYEGDDLKRFLGTIALSIFFLSLFITIVLLACGSFLVNAIGFSVSFYPYIFIAILNTFLATFTAVPIAILRIREKPFQVLTIAVCSSVINVALVVYFLVFRDRGVSGVLEATFWTSLSLNLFFFIPFTLRNIKISFSREYFREAVAYGLPLLPHGLAGYVFMYSDRIILERFVSLGSIGLYNIGDRFGSMMKTGVNSFNDASAPYFLKLSKSNPRSKEIYAEIITVWAVFATLAALAISLFSKEIVRLMTTPEFYDAYTVVPILVLAYLLRGLYCFPVNALFYAKKTTKIPVITISAASLNIGLNLLWIPEYGITGAAWATVCAFALTVVLAYHYSRKYYPLIYERGKLMKIFGGALAVFLAAWFISEPMSPGFALLVKLAAIVAYGFLVLAFRVITIETVREILSRFLPSSETS